MKNRPLTPEQAAARDARRETFKKLWKQVAAMPEAERLAKFAKLGIVTVEGHELSLCNMLMVALQFPAATVVGGFRQWIKQGRCVRKGEHGAMIWCPTGKRGEPEAPTTEPAENEADGDKPRFIIGTVFDISQTEVQS